MSINVSAEIEFPAFEVDQLENSICLYYKLVLFVTFKTS